MNGLSGATKRVADHARSIVQLEIQLAATELKRKVAALAIGIGLGVGAGTVLDRPVYVPSEKVGAIEEGTVHLGIDSEEYEQLSPYEPPPQGGRFLAS